MRWLVLLLPLALGACEVGRIKLPMTLGASDAAPASCLDGDTLASDDCRTPASRSTSQEKN